MARRRRVLAGRSARRSGVSHSSGVGVAGEECAWRRSGRRMPFERAAGFIAREGPATGQDRWEEDAGINVFTLAVAIAALVEASAFLEGEARAFALRLADYWNAAAGALDLCRRHAARAPIRRQRLLHPYLAGGCAEAQAGAGRAGADQEPRLRSRLARQRAGRHRFPAARALRAAERRRSAHPRQSEGRRRLAEERRRRAVRSGIATTTTATASTTTARRSTARAGGEVGRC